LDYAEFRARTARGAFDYTLQPWEHTTRSHARNPKQLPTSEPSEGPNHERVEKWEEPRS